MAERVDLDRSPGSQLEQIVQTAIGRSRASLNEAQRLRDGGFAGPAMVWAVRSVEIFTKEVMLLPHFLEVTHGDWKLSWRKVRRLFDDGNWKVVLTTVDDAFGPLEPMLTDDGKNVLDIWRTTVAGRRGSVVHGGSDSTPEEASLLVQWAEMMMTQLTLRLIHARKHPLADFFGHAIKTAAHLVIANESAAS